MGKPTVLPIVRRTLKRSRSDELLFVYLLLHFPFMHIHAVIIAVNVFRLPNQAFRI